RRSVAPLGTNDLLTLLQLLRDRIAARAGPGTVLPIGGRRWLRTVVSPRRNPHGLTTLGPLSLLAPGIGATFGVTALPGPVLSLDAHVAIALHAWRCCWWRSGPRTAINVPI